MEISVDRLLALAEQEIAPRTMVQYAAGLRYWALWHQLRYDCALPLTGIPSRAVSSEVISAFIDDHLVIALDGRLKMRMADEIFGGLRKAGFSRSADCASPTTVCWRLNVLSKFHKLSNLRIDHELLGRRKPELYAVWKAEFAALSVSEASPMSVSEALTTLLRGCDEGIEGVMASALIVILARLTTKQVTQLRLSDIASGKVTLEGREQDTVELTIRNPVGDFQRFRPKVYLVGQEAALVRAWWSIREGESNGNDDSFFRRKPRGGRSRTVDQSWISFRVREMASNSGFLDAGGRVRVSARWLRKQGEREWFEQSDIVNIARMLGIDGATFVRMTRKKGSKRDRESSTR